MKALPIRKGNDEPLPAVQATSQASMKAPPKRKGDGGDPHRLPLSSRASMKVYTSRYRTNGPVITRRGILICLIESPSEEEGKFSTLNVPRIFSAASMKALPKKRKGNCDDGGRCQCLSVASMKVPTKKREIGLEEPE